MLRVAILTRHDDFHAYVVRQVLVERGIQCPIILTDSIAWVGGLSWSMSDEVTSAVVRDADDQEVTVADLHVIWWRRLTGEPRIPVTLPDGAHDLVVNDCRAALLGMLMTDFVGTWISHPEATRTAQNKLLQLKTAQQMGLRIPRTLVSQDPDRVRRFCKDHVDQVVVKTVSGAQGTPVMA
ncbi:MAG: ATP-grasp domain-containing protein, partial [Thermomicrobiales bacterium]